MSSISSNNSIRESWKKINAIQGHKRYSQIHFIQDGNKIIAQSADIANVLADTFVRNSSSQNFSDVFQEYKNEEEKEELPDDYDDKCSPLQLNNPITMEELLTTIESTNNSSPGPDNIPNILIKNLPTLGKEVLLDVYNYIWTKRVFPKIWKMAIVVPVAKPGKDPSKSDNYRPISLTCNMCKILEKIINKRLRWFLDTQKIINDNQFGFRSGHSTMSHLISVDSQIQEAFMNNQHVIAVSLDIEKAYDMVWKRRILKILQIIGIKGNMYDFIKNFSLDRKLQVRINGQLSDIKQIENGVPQGSVLSVTLFLLSINDIDKGVQPPVIIRKYADDITVLCKGKSVPSTQKTMQKALNTIFEWSLSTGFKFSAKKTECMFFSKRIDTVSPKLQLGTQPLRFVNKMKILGLQFDPKLTWKIHIQELIMECKKRLNVIKCLSNNNWGADKNLLLLTYKAIIRSKIDYGSLLYQSANKKELRKIESIHNKGLRICTGCFHTTPIGSILIEAQETSLNHRRKTLNLKYAAKAASSTNPIIHNDIFLSYRISIIVTFDINLCTVE